MDGLFNPIYYTAEHRAFASSIKRFVEKEISPYVNEWDEAETFPRELYQKAASVGLLGLGFDAEHGGIPDADAFYVMLAAIEMAKAASGGVHISLMIHSIGTPPIHHFAQPGIRDQVMPQIIAGEKISALAITEPSGGSDVAAIKTKAVREGDYYILNGEKTFITSGMRADWITVAVRTGEEKGASGLSLILVPGDSAGLRRSRLHKMGWQCSDTAQLFFDGVRVPASHLVGAEGQGFRAIMHNFNGERLGIACGALGFAQACYDEALAWAQQRKTFGVTLNQHQVIRHKLVDIRSTEAWLNAVAARADGGDTGADWVGEVCVLKNHATQTMQFCADTAVQILGGMGFMRGTVSERIYREVKVLTIGGGTEEIMKELAARQWRI